MQMNRVLGTATTSATYTLDTGREEVWSVLLDPTTPAHLLPGSGTAEVLPDGVRAHVVLRDGAVAQDCDLLLTRRVAAGGHRLQVVVETHSRLGRTETHLDLHLTENIVGRCELSVSATVHLRGLLRMWGRQTVALTAAAQADATAERLHSLLRQAPAPSDPVTARAPQILQSVPAGPATATSPVAA